MKPFYFARGALLGAVLGSLLTVAGCSKRGGPDRVAITDPKAAASSLEQTFESAPASVQENVRLVSEAMRHAEYEKAIVSLGIVREQTRMTLDQGLAIHGAVVSMESEILAAMQSGDPNAARAYALLRALKRN